MLAPVPVGAARQPAALALAGRAAARCGTPVPGIGTPHPFRRDAAFLAPGTEV
ncbi:hypothetical protein [Pseudoduganella chitinolytica]|uniref:Uncharacterized protein n=1 Tax=Pseudoduganella chitinolytica TaxID=34070 RepID=A0ABY8BK43_9BURK|nr:hypothetical protein [Pseudoduganella chitinolytica]WEF34629.1 hypothetical protein PX653_07665 [Pseudoduganella chitinolytica]